MTGTLFPGIMPPQAPKSDRARFIRRAQAAILQIGLRGGEVNADHVHRLAETPEGVSPNTMGTIFYGLAKSGLIAPVRFERSGRPSRHGNVFRTWRIADYAGAVAYLKALRGTGDTHEI
jgi:hypothetical protein